MKPYYQDQAVTIYHGDCREILPELPKVDLVLTDPPYDKKTHDGAFANINFKPLGDMEELVKMFLEISNGWCISFCSLEMLGDYKKFSGNAWIRAGIWDRISNMPQMTGDRPAQGAEGVAIFHRKGRKKWNGGGKAAIWRHLVERNMKEHPTQKPLSLFIELVGLFSEQNALILDPFMGSGTTLRAAKDLGRKAIGIELEEKYCEIAAKRMAQEVLL